MIRKKSMFFTFTLFQILMSQSLPALVSLAKEPIKSSAIHQQINQEASSELNIKIFKKKKRKKSTPPTPQAPSTPQAPRVPQTAPPPPSPSAPQIPPYWYASGTPIMNFIKPVTVSGKPSGIFGVDCIYLINLDRRPERLARMQQILNAYGLHFQRLSAVDGKQLTHEAKKTLFGPYPIRITDGLTGNILSHLSILHDAYERGFQCIWVLEDDVLFLEDPQIFDPLLQALSIEDPEWDLFFTDVDAKDNQGQYVPACVSDFRPGQPSKPIAYYQKKQLVGSHFYRIRQRFGVWSLFVSRNGMQKLLNYFQHVYLWGAMDVDLFYTPNLHCYTTRRDIVTQWLEGQYSDTAN